MSDVKTSIWIFLGSKDYCSANKNGGGGGNKTNHNNNNKHHERESEKTTLPGTTITISEASLPPSRLLALKP